MCTEVFFKLINTKKSLLHVYYGIYPVSENVATVIINDASTTLFTFIEFFYFFNPNDTGLIIYKSKTFH